MGNCDCQMVEDDNKISKSQFREYEAIGKGGFGRVIKVQCHKSKAIYSMKQMSKAIICYKTSVESVVKERYFLSILHHPFLINMSYAFQDYYNLYIIMDYLAGGDLRHRIGKIGKFTEMQAKFTIACVIIALEYLRSMDVIHRDLKPENLVFDDNGYIHVTDFGISKELIDAQKGDDTSGTPCYMAPEVIIGKPHDFVSDYYALGIIAYELMMGKRPYEGRTLHEIRSELTVSEKKLKKKDLPKKWNESCIDFINGLLKRKPNQRLGYHSLNEIKKHEWLKLINWNDIEGMKCVSPFEIDPMKHNYDKSYVDKMIEVDYQNGRSEAEYLHKAKSEGLFRNYYYNKDEMRNQYGVGQVSHFECGTTTDKSNNQSSYKKLVAAVPQTIKISNKRNASSVKVKRSSGISD